MFEKLFKKHKPEVKKDPGFEEWHRQREAETNMNLVRMECNIGHPKSEIISRSQLIADNINQERYDKAVEYVNKLLNTLDSYNCGSTLALEGEYALNTFEAVKLKESIKKSGYKCYLSCEDNKPYAITVSLG